MWFDGVMQRVRVRLVHDGAQPGPPLPEALRFGLQDKAGNVHPGVPRPGSRLLFDVDLHVRADRGGREVFGGSFVHGPPTARFLYLSWKREGEHAAPWGWRIKVALASISTRALQLAEQGGMGLVADVTDRKPHTSEPVYWSAGRLNE